MPYKDPEKQKERNARYYQENKEKLDTKNKEWRINNPNASKAIQAKYRLSDKGKASNYKYAASDKGKETNAKYRASPKGRETRDKWQLNNKDKVVDSKERYYSKNKDKVVATAKKWKAENPDKVKDSSLRYRHEFRSSCGYHEDLIQKRIKDNPLHIHFNKEQVGNGFPDYFVVDTLNKKSYYLEFKCNKTCNLSISLFEKSQKRKIKEMIKDGKDVRAVMGNKNNYKEYSSKDIMEAF